MGISRQIFAVLRHTTVVLTLASAGGGLRAEDANVAPLEFRGTMTEGGRQLFSLFDRAEHRSYWLQLDERIAGHRLVSFDSEHLALHLTAGNLPVTLPLCGGRILVGAPRPAIPVAAPAVVATEEGGDQTFEVARLQREQAELLARRAARENFGAKQVKDAPVVPVNVPPR